MVSLLKKGSKQVRDNHRGLLLSDHIGKAAAVVLDKEIESTSNLSQTLPNTQCGAVAKKAPT